MSDSSRHAAFKIREVNYGETPTTPAFGRLRHTSFSVGVQRGSLQSEELRPDRQIADFRLGTITVSGDIGGELSYGTYDDELEEVLMGTWAPKATKTATTFSAATADDSFNDSGNQFITKGFQVGDVINITGFTTPGNNGQFTITSVAAGKIIVENTDGTPATGIALEAAGASVTIATAEDVLKAGVVRRSSSILREFSDIPATGDGKPFHLLNGIELNTLAMTINPTAIVTVTFGVMGREGVAPSNTAPTGATFANPTTTSPMDAFTGALLVNGTENGLVTEFSVNLENGLEVRNVVGSKFTIRPSVGRSNMTGSATVYFESAEMVEAFLNEENTSMQMELPDAEGNSYTLILPRVKFTAGQPDTAGQGSVTLTMPFQGIYDPTTGTNIIIKRNPKLA